MKHVHELLSISRCEAISLLANDQVVSRCSVCKDHLLLRTMYWKENQEYRRCYYICITSRRILRVLCGHRRVSSGNSSASEVSMNGEKSVAVSKTTHSCPSTAHTSQTQARVWYLNSKSGAKCARQCIPSRNGCVWLPGSMDTGNPKILSLRLLITVLDTIDHAYLTWSWTTNNIFSCFWVFGRGKPFFRSDRCHPCRFLNWRIVTEIGVGIQKKRIGAYGKFYASIDLKSAWFLTVLGMKCAIENPISWEFQVTSGLAINILKPNEHPQEQTRSFSLDINQDYTVQVFERKRRVRGELCASSCRLLTNWSLLWCNIL